VFSIISAKLAPRSNFLAKKEKIGATRQKRPSKRRTFPLAVEKISGRGGD
jgi:hypothetical protein